MLFRCVRLFCAAFRAEFACIYRTASASPAVCRLRLYRLLSVLLWLSRLCAAERIAALWLLRLLWLLIVVVWVLLICNSDPGSGSEDEPYRAGRLDPFPCKSAGGL